MLTCEVCGGGVMLLGTLGRLTWFRCRFCGMELTTGEPCATVLEADEWSLPEQEVWE